MAKKEELQKKARYLQRLLVQLSFMTKNERPTLYSNTLNSLKKVQKQLIDLKQENKVYEYER
jgi:hypothetical protein